RHIPHPHEGAVCVCSNNDVAKLLRSAQATLGANGIGKVLTFLHRFASDLARWIYIVLFLNCADDLRHSDTHFGQLIRLHPKPHRVLTRSVYLYDADTW